MKKRAQRTGPSSGSGDSRPVHVRKFPFLAGMAAKMREAISSLLPLGYEDETGFHLGDIHPKSDPNKDSQPPSCL
jgi:hypothetical protein